jgi:multidrug efflux pump subunit AcrA (membrane-fusion protein)
MQQGAIVVPKSATFARQTELLVWVLGDDGTVQSVTIDPLAAWNNDVIVESGLKAGQRIVVEGLAKLRPGVKVVDLGAQPPAPEVEAAPASGGDAPATEHPTTGT